MSSAKLAEIIEQFGPAYMTQYPLNPDQWKVARSIQCCRTPVMGGVHLQCDACDHHMLQYYSCRNRHCPQCQKQASQEWLELRQKDLLPVPYFHLVFTLPHGLNGWVKLHPRIIYGLLFKSVWATLQKFGQDAKRLDGQLGVTAVLHTWGQKLDQHVHLHCLIPAGAWSDVDGCWHASRSNYLFPVKALSRCFRGKMVSLLRKSYKDGDLCRITHKDEVNEVLNTVMKKPWVVYTKACHGKPEKVLNYLSRYTYRIAISESRVERISNTSVTFTWKDYRDKGQKQMELNGVEFLRRFMQHVLPKGFMRIRHFGFLSNRHRRDKLEKIKQAMGKPPIDVVPNKRESEDPLHETEKEKPRLHPWFCFHCHSTSVHVLQRFQREKPRRKAG